MWFPMDGRDRFDVRGTPFIGCLDVRAGTPTHQQCYGGHSERETPGHIPNPEAKTLSADGTAGVTLWESRTPPDSLRGAATPAPATVRDGVAGSLESPTRLPDGGPRRD